MRRHGSPGAEWVKGYGDAMSVILASLLRFEHYKTLEPANIIWLKAMSQSGAYTGRIGPCEFAPG